jgi:hypothetical protein
MTQSPRRRNKDFLRFSERANEFYDKVPNKSMSSIADIYPNDRSYLKEMRARGTTFDKPPSFESFLNKSLIKPEAIVRP